jgi:hypothetical protein
MNLNDLLAYIFTNITRQYVSVFINGQPLTLENIRIQNNAANTDIHFITEQPVIIKINTILEKEIIDLARAGKRLGAIILIRNTFHDLTILEARNLYNHVLLTKAPQLFEKAKV